MTTRENPHVPMWTAIDADFAQQSFPGNNSEVVGHQRPVTREQFAVLMTLPGDEGVQSLDTKLVQLPTDQPRHRTGDVTDVAVRSGSSESGNTQIL